MGDNSKLWRLVAIVAALVVFVALPFGSVAADEAAERKKLIAAAKDHLKEMTEQIKDVAGASKATGALKAAQESIKLRKTIAELEQVKGDDAVARDMIRNWPDRAKDFLNTVGALAALKKDQGVMDKIGGGDGLAEWCKKRQDDLEDEVEKNASIIEVLNAGKKAANKYKQYLADARKVVAEATAAESQAGQFEAGGFWKPLSDAVETAAQDMRDDIEDRYKSAQKNSDCRNLASANKNPIVKAANKALMKDAEKEISNFQRDVDDWEKQAAGYFSLSCQSMKTVTDFFCNGDTEGAAGNAAIWNLARKAADTAIKGFEPLAKQLETLKDRAEVFENHPQVSEGAKKIIKETIDEATKLDKIKRDGNSPFHLTGRDHPAIKYYIRYGQEMHKKMESSHKCDVRDRSFGGSGRPDCVKAKGCMILEFKPNSASAEKKGRTQLNKYLPAVTKYYTARIEKPKNIARDLGGAQMMANLKKNGCVKSGKVRFNTKVVKYSRCKARYKCVQ